MEEIVLRDFFKLIPKLNNKHLLRLDRSVAYSLNCPPQYGGYKDTHVALKHYVSRISSSE